METDSCDKDLQEKIKNLNTSLLFKKNSYIEIFQYDQWFPGYIIETKPNNKFDIIYSPTKGQLKRKNDISIKQLNFFGENNLQNGSSKRENCLNYNLHQVNVDKLFEIFNDKLNKININNNENNDFIGYETYQFVSGYIFDILINIYTEITQKYIERKLIDLLLEVLKVIINALKEIKNNLDKLKFVLNNKKVIIFSAQYAILASIDNIIINLPNLFMQDFTNFPEINEKFAAISNLVYDLLVIENNKKNFNIPINILVNIIDFLTCKNDIAKHINKFDKTLICKLFMKNIENLKGNELKNKKINIIEKYILYSLQKLFPKNNITKIFNQCFYPFLANCLKSNILEIKINALNKINELLSENQHEFNTEIYNFFIENNKILEIIFEEGTHDEILKRSIYLFKYLAFYDKLNEEILEKLIIAKNNNNEIIKNILIEIISELPFDKKEKLFKKLTSTLNFDKNINDIYFLSKLIEACFKNYGTKQNNNNNDNHLNCGLIGLNLLFKYIIKDFDPKKYDYKNNVSKAIEIFCNVFSKILKNIELKDIIYFVNKAVENIKTNENHNSVVQSIKLLKNIMSNFDGNNIIIWEQIINKVDQNYNIIQLIIDDLIRYINNIMTMTDSKIKKDKVYEGIYTHQTNIEQRLKIIFYLLKGGNKNLLTANDIEKIYDTFNSTPRLNADKLLFFDIMSKNIQYIDSSSLLEFFNNILSNKSFEIYNFSEEQSLTLITKIFIKINIDAKTLYEDKKNIRVIKDNIINIDVLYEILIKNKNPFIQNKICELLNSLCLNLTDYKTNFCSNYWKIYINKISNIFEKLYLLKNYEGMGAIAKLIDLIYTNTRHFGGKIPQKEDTHPAEKPYELFHFCCPDLNNKQYKLGVGEKDKILDMRWKAGYYYDIPINNVVFIDKDNNAFTFKDEELYFQRIFPPKIYCQTEDSEDFILITVRNIPDQILEIQDNPKVLIENNDKIYNILHNSLFSEHEINADNKQIILNLLNKLPKNKYIKNEIESFIIDNSKEIKDKFKKIFDLKEIYILVFTLQSIKEYLNNKEKKIDNSIYILNLIKIQRVDNYLYHILLQMNLKNNNLIDFECLSLTFDILKIIEKTKENNCVESKDYIINKIGKQRLFAKLTDLIISIINIDFSLLYKNTPDNIEILFNLEIISNDKEDNRNYLGCNKNLKIRKINKIIFGLLEKIMNFIEQITSDTDISFLAFLLSDQDLFKQIFLIDYIKCEKNDLKKLLNSFLSKHIFKEQYIKKYFDIILNLEVFSFIVKNDIDGSYFKFLSFLMQKFNEENKQNNFNTENKQNKKNIELFKQIINLIINYIQDKKNDNSDNILENTKIEGILDFFKNILNLYPTELVSYVINKIDIYELFVNKCILRKCNKNPLNTEKMLCTNNESQEALFNLVIFILKNINEKSSIEMKIWEKINKFHQTGFWKSNKNKDWELESKEILTGKYIGLKNMTATCYMNSILQQFFMIPMLRETLLSINTNNKHTVLYQAQLLFSALKLYEYKYYDPKPFVLISGLNFYEQMDADEYYGQFIDKIENEIKQIFSIDNKNNSDYKYKDLFKFFFGIKVIDELKFIDCGHKRYNEFYYNNIQLEIKGFSNIKESLDNYCKIEVMDGDNKINCEECNTKRACHKRQIFKSLPNFLVIALKRFEFDYDTMLKYKLNNYFEFPFELNMKQYLLDKNSNNENTEYELSGITIHYGTSDFGHYYDLIKAQDGKWYKFNDTNVKEFKENEIAEEAFGAQNLDDDLNKDMETKGKDLNNAYILFYRKKKFEEGDIKNFCINYKTDLALPPYNKFSNIRSEFINIINIQMFKYWTLENILNPMYQGFIINLLKIDLVRNLDKRIEPNYLEIFKELREEEYLTNNNNNSIIKNNIIFEYGLRYYFNIMLRTSLRENKNKENRSKLHNLIKCYIESDSNKAQFILEEFSDNDAINEYLVFCPSIDSVKNCCDIIITSFKKFLKDKEKNDKSILYKFINSIFEFITINYKSVNLDSLIILFNQLINSDIIFIQYVKDKNFEVWITSVIISDERNVEEDGMMQLEFDEKSIQTLKSNHFILTEKKNEIFEQSLLDENQKGDKLSAVHKKKLSDTDKNIELFKQISKNLKKFN